MWKQRIHEPMQAIAEPGRGKRKQDNFKIHKADIADWQTYPKPHAPIALCQF